MNNQNQILRGDEVQEIMPPPRFVLWLAVVIVLLIIVSGLGLLAIVQNGFSMAALFDIGIKGAAIMTVGSVLAAALFRQNLPSRFLPILTAVLVVGWLIGGTLFALVYRNSLAPGQRETTKSLLPFMAIFDPPLPSADTSLPTPIPNEESGISPEDLLAAPLGFSSTEEATESPTTQVVPSATVIPATATLTPATASPAASATPEATEAIAAVPTLPATTEIEISQRPLRQAAARLYGFTVVKQTWNNCGPANITMALSYYGWKQGQEVAQAYLRPDKEDKNVNPSEIVAFVNEQSGVRALTRMGGDMELLKLFLSNNLPVLIETGYLYEGSDWLGHYQTVVGYDDAVGAFYVYDSYLGTGENSAGIAKTYSEFDEYWQHFNRTFIVLYKQEEENLVRTLLGERANVNIANEIAAETAQREATANPQNSFAWFNLGSSLTRLGQYERAAAAFDQSRRIGGLPWRITLYQFGMFEAYYNIGRNDDVVGLVESNLNNGGTYVEETHYWRGLVLAARGDGQGAGAAFRQALQHNPRFAAAQDALNSLTA